MEKYNENLKFLSLNVLSFFAKVVWLWRPEWLGVLGKGAIPVIPPPSHLQFFYATGSV